MDLDSEHILYEMPLKKRPLNPDAMSELSYATNRKE